MKKILMTAAIGTALIFGAMSANAQPMDENGKPMPPEYRHHREFTPEMKAKMEKRKAEIEKRLKLTDKQKEQLKAIHEKAKAEIAPKIKLLSEAEFELEVLQKRKFNEEKYQAGYIEYKTNYYDHLKDRKRYLELIDTQWPENSEEYKEFEELTNKFKSL